MSFDIDLSFDEAAIAQLYKIPLLMMDHVIDKCIPAMVKPIVVKAKAIAPRSDRPTANSPKGSGAKWGNKKTDHFDPGKWREYHSGDNIGYRIRKNSSEGAYVKVGAISPKGNKQRFNQFKYTNRRVFYWGKDMNMQYEPPYRFMQRAFDETVPLQQASFLAALKKFTLP